ncbi:LysR family transcriptional regulator [Yersinia frederiksenii]|uniref:LysR family transcriptional regulator n=2 Tax=Yersinia frederiksenii TaxID=29484 RepID=A0A380PR06_YERFR|nr:LysR family transcriptional regulator [Yersinia frederiksenii]ATM95638.1 LysR family transcriptional regulator [Yersinia frederiksenii]EEQ15136.1 Transcriptional regulator, LysR family [Yersinia frederiksenii ATCC 33641]KGA44536.1 bacterial regulatory helix-turn-helix, lysR family protein [Yersinia frederiksenii ATCC 33641]SUP75729.1 LysR family transcriptional regulator [Yersinia frederiksenii]
MARDNYSYITAFLAVAREGNFTRAAAQLGVSQSALSHSIRTLEAKLGIRLLTRTTRSVSLTEVGEHLFKNLAPRFEEIEMELAAATEFRDKPSGTIRITATDYAIRTVLWPKLQKLVPEYPDLKLEIIIDYSLADIVAERYDIGIRMGDQVANGMVAVRISPDIRFVIVGASEYFKNHSRPKTPQELTTHNCMNLRLPTRGGLYLWELEKEGQKLQVRVEGQLIFNSIYEILNATLSGAGIAFMPENLAAPHVASGHLQYVLQDWYPTFPGIHAYYPSIRQPSRALALVIETLRLRSQSLGEQNQND